VSSFFLERHFDARAPIFHPTRADREGRALAALVFTAGAAYAAWYVSIAKSLAIAFGNAADVALATLAAGMAGIAAGSAIGAELATRRGHALRVLAFCLVVAALLGASTPWLISALPSLAVAVSVIVLPSAVMIGLALPSLVQYAARPNVGKAIAWLAVPALTGAALGAWLTGYIVLPFLGVGATTWIPVLANLCAGLVALRRSARAPAMAHDPISTLDRAASAHGRLPLSILAGGSLAAVGVATIDVHLLSAVATSSAYSCALIVSVLAVSTAAGTALARRGLQEPTLMYLATIELAFTMAVLVSAHVWNALPGYFASFAGYSLTRTFASRELVRFAVGSIMLVPPAFCIGTLFPAAMDVVARGSKSPERALGRATAAAMLGGLGGVGVALLLVARVGSLRALEATGAIAFLLGLAPLIRTRAPARGPVALAATFVVALFLVYPKDLDYVALSGGAHVHFEAAPTGRSIDHTESLESGIVTVSESNPAPGDRVLTLLSNGELSSNAFAEQSTLLN
jgi:spermidine synthase